MDGVNGAILDLKDRRDSSERRKVHGWAKVVTWAFLGVVASAILFFIYLFGIQQTQSRQQAWFKSFVVWIVLEILCVSSLIVLIQHVFIPLIALSDVRRVQERVVRDIVSFNAKMKKIPNRKIVQKPQSFNAASFLFPSYKLASMNSSLKDSAVITRYHTTFPKKAFGSDKSSNLKKNYDLRFTFIKQALPRIAIFAISSMIQLPPPVQDAFTEIVSSVGFGYIGMLHVRLYRISPVFAFLPLLAAVLIVHFLTASGRAKSRLDLSKTFPVDDDSEEDVSTEDVCKTTGFIVEDSEQKDNKDHKDGNDLFQSANQHPTWKSRRASAVESLNLAHSLGRRHEMRALTSAQVHSDMDNEASSSNSSSGGNGTTDDDTVVHGMYTEHGEPLVQWEDDDMGPDSAANRSLFHNMWSASDSSEMEDLEGVWAIDTEGEEEEEAHADEDMTLTNVIASTEDASRMAYPLHREEAVIPIPDGDDATDSNEEYDALAATWLHMINSDDDEDEENDRAVVSRIIARGGDSR